MEVNTSTAQAEDLTLCGNLTEEYEQLWRAYEFWCEGVLFTSLGIFGKLDLILKENILVIKQSGLTQKKWEKVYIPKFESLYNHVESFSIPYMNDLEDLAN